MRKQHAYAWSGQRNTWYLKHKFSSFLSACHGVDEQGDVSGGDFSQLGDLVSPEEKLRSFAMITVIRQWWNDLGFWKTCSHFSTLKDQHCLGLGLRLTIEKHVSLPLSIRGLPAPCPHNKWTFIIIIIIIIVCACVCAHTYGICARVHMFIHVCISVILAFLWRLKTTSESWFCSSFIPAPLNVPG